jgi:hypothetical protein
MGIIMRAPFLRVAGGAPTLKVVTVRNVAGPRAILAFLIAGNTFRPEILPVEKNRDETCHEQKKPGIHAGASAYYLFQHIMLPPRKKLFGAAFPNITGSRSGLLPDW